MIKFLRRPKEGHKRIHDLKFKKELEIIEKQVRARKQPQIYQGQFNTCDFVKG